jgi:formamidopyrimidine-DNA glycosylase
MPELPEVETVRRGLAPLMEGGRIERVELRRPDLRFPLPRGFARRLAGRTIHHLGRRAKYLLAELDDSAVLIMHLGMSGSFRLIDGAGPPRPHDHVIFDLSNGHRIAFNDPRRFGMMDLTPAGRLAENRHLAGLGVEPLSNQFNGAVLAQLFGGRLAPLKAALLDQRLIAGLGNIYVCEALWRSELSPKRAAGSIVRKDGTSTARAELLAGAIRAVLTEAIDAGGSTIRNHVRADGTVGEFQNSFSTYDREGEPCLKLRCDGVIRRIVQSGRSTFYCPVCQR